jgi:phenylacetate-CoA ligase
MIFGDVLDLVRFARQRCPYYRDLYRDLPDEPRWEDVPCLDVERYWQAKGEDLEASLTRNPPDGWLWTTGGSTLRSKRVMVSAEDFREEARFFSRALVAAGLVAGDRVANLTWAGELSASFILTGSSAPTGAGGSDQSNQKFVIPSESRPY